MDYRRGWWVVAAWLIGCSDDALVGGSTDGSSSGAASSESTGQVADSSSSGGSSSDSSSGGGDGQTSSSSSSSDSSSSDGSSSGGDGHTSSSSDSGSSSSDSSSSDGSATLATTTTSASTEATSSGSGSSDTESSSTDACVPQPNGEMCSEACECESGACYIVGLLGGICGECLVDADCNGGGCTAPNYISDPPVGAVCNDGSLGGGCQTDAACQDPLVCNSIIDIPGVLDTTTCGECESDADCAGSLCSPSYEITALTGAWVCVDAGSVPNGEGCDYGGSGDSACASGHCAISDVMGLFQLGVCGECEVDDDCAMGQYCDPPQVDITMGLTPSTCI